MNRSANSGKLDYEHYIVFGTPDSSGKFIVSDLCREIHPARSIGGKDLKRRITEIPGQAKTGVGNG